MSKNISGLLQYATALKSETEEKVNQAIDVLKRSKSKKINFTTVSELSGILTTTLYNNPVLRERISSLRDNIDTHQPFASDTASSSREQELRQEIQKLKEDKKMLIQQLVEFEALKTENKQLKALLSQQKLE